jgi:thiaminase/transcriptional activator TenA
MMTDILWKAAEPIIEVTERHPFLSAMVYGTLPKSNFIYYVLQDALYLKSFAECLRHLSEKTEATDQDAIRLKDFAIGAEEAEMSLHNSFFKKWEIDSSLATEMPNTLLYTSYILRIVSTRDYAEGLAALLPCFWVYMHVGKCMLRLRNELGDAVQRYPQFDEWIDMYSGDEFENHVSDYIKIVNSVAVQVDEDKFNIMKEHFVLCCKLEHMFWDQAMSLMEWPSIAEVEKPVSE